jgi:hypothetical protein
MLVRKSCSRAGWPDWANFRRFGVGLYTLSSFLKITKDPDFWYFFHRKSLRFCNKDMGGLHFGRFLHKIIWSPCSRAITIPIRNPKFLILGADPAISFPTAVFRKCLDYKKARALRN